MATARPLSEVGINIEGELIAIAGLALVFALSAGLLARWRLAPGSQVVLSRTAAGGLWLLAITGFALLLVGGSAENELVLFLLAAPITALLGLAGLASLWSRLRERHRLEAIRLALVTSGLVLLGTVATAAPYLAWSAGWIGPWPAATIMAIVLGGATAA
ncbi:MAG: hypothetical protein GY953_47305, partial [bacterium]|nr:hypothetical protein [bacterium]